MLSNPARLYCKAFHISEGCSFAFGSHLVLTLSYTLIACMLGVLVFRHRRYLPHYSVFLLFVGSIVAVGITQLVRFFFQEDLPKSVTTALRYMLPITFLAACFWIKAIIPVVSDAVFNVAKLDVVRQDARYKALVDVIAEFVWTADAEGYFDPASRRAWCALTGLSDNPNYFDRYRAVHSDDSLRIQLSASEAIKAGSPYHMQCRVWVEEESDFRWFESRGVPVHDPNGRVVEWVGAIINVHEQYERQQALEKALNNATEAAIKAEKLAQMAESASKAKTDFLAVMSHELRTPLTAVSGFAELMADGVLGELQPQQKDAIRRIQQSGQHLVGMIDQILDFSGIEAGKIQVRAEVVPVNKVIKDVLELVRPFMVDRKLDLYTNVDKLLLMSTDPQKLRQILINLMTNALKFTPKGSVVLNVFGRDDAIVFQVSDTGIGIPEQYQEKIFEQFWQVKQGLTRNVGGAGLGLTICKRFVEALGGEIYLKSLCAEDLYGTLESPGTTFTVVLPSNMPQSQVEEIRSA